MPRIGKHPLKVTGLKDEFQPAPITITTIVHIPIQEGYWAQSMDVLKLFFSSLAENTPQPYDLMVFDNGSCTEVQDYLIGLRRDGIIQYLTLSEHNLKKLGALNFLLSSAPGDYVAYADSDVYFLSGWLETSLDVLETFPEAGKVTALPIVGGDTTEISHATYSNAKADPTIDVNIGLLVEEEYVNAHRISLGQTTDQYKAKLLNRKDTRITRNGVSAFISGADFQFTITRTALEKVLPLEIKNPEEYYDPIYSPVLEYRLDDAGLWQLSTIKYLVHHMGNRIPDLEEDLPWLKQIASTNTNININNKLNKRVIQNRWVRRILQQLNVKIYKMLYGD